MSRRALIRNPRDFIATTSHLSCAELGALVRMLGYHVVNDELPECEDRLRRIAGAQPGQFPALLAAVREFLPAPPPELHCNAQEKPQGGSGIALVKGARVEAEMVWRVAQVWSAHLQTRKRYYERRLGRRYVEPSMTAEVRKAIRLAIREHDAALLGADQRDEWKASSAARAAGIGLFLDPWCTAQDPESPREYLEPWRPWKRLQGKADPVPRFAQRFWDYRAGIDREDERAADAPRDPYEGMDEDERIAAKAADSRAETPESVARLRAAAEFERWQDSQARRIV